MFLKYRGFIGDCVWDYLLLSYFPKSLCARPHLAWSKRETTRCHRGHKGCNYCLSAVVALNEMKCFSAGTWTHLECLNWGLFISSSSKWSGVNKWFTPVQPLHVQVSAPWSQVSTPGLCHGRSQYLKQIWGFWKWVTGAGRGMALWGRNLWAKMMKLKWRTVFDPVSCRIYNIDKCSIPKVKEHIKKKVQSKLETGGFSVF